MERNAIMKPRKILSLLLALTTMMGCFSPMMVCAATDTTQEISNQDVSKNVNVDANIASTFRIIIPKTITLDGKTKSANYEVTMSGDLASNEIVTVTPDESFAIF